MKQIALHNMGEPHPVKTWIEQMTDFLWVKGNSTADGLLTFIAHYLFPG